MEIREVGCDRKGCTRRNAKTLSIFSRRAPDGTDGMEDMYHIFDLCAECAHDLLCAALEELGRERAKKLVDGYEITTRVG